MLLTTRRIKKRFEQALEVPNIMKYSAFEDVDRIEGKLGISNKKYNRNKKTVIMIRKRHIRPL